MPDKQKMFGYIIFMGNFKHVGLVESLLAASPYEKFTQGGSSSQSGATQQRTVLQCSHYVLGFLPLVLHCNRHLRGIMKTFLNLN